jgi:hypothetical protein
MVSWHEGHAQGEPTDFHIGRPGTMGIPAAIGPLDEAAIARRENGVSQRVHGVFASAKNDASIRWSTPEQRDFMDPYVTAYTTAPEMVRFNLDGRRHEHVPAFAATVRQRRAILDVFPGRGRGVALRTGLIGALTSIYADRGIAYRAVNGRDIRLEPRFGNAKWIRSRSWHHPTQEEIFLVTGALTAEDHRTIAALQAELPQVADVGAVVGAMAVARHLHLDLSASEPDQIVVSLDPKGRRR